MKKEDLRILFLGTTSFAVEHLRFLIEECYNVVGIVTPPDKPAGRGHKLKGSPVKEFAVDLGIPIFQPEKLREESFLESIRGLNPTLGIVIAFRMLPKEVWRLPSMGTINVHASLLPRWRGAAPINHALIAGDKETGVSLFSLTDKLDEGDVIAIRTIPLSEQDYFGAIHDLLAQEGVLLLKETLSETINQGLLPRGIQQLVEGEPLYAHKLTKENTRISWNQPAVAIHNLVRGLSPIPSAWTTLVEKGQTDTPAVYKIFETEVIVDYSSASLKKRPRVGSFLPAPKGCLYVVTQEGVLSIRSLQAPGKKRLDISAFLNGFHIPEGSYFE